jgi:hypothetical protein
MIQNIWDQQDFYQQYKVIFAGGIIPVIIDQKQRMNSMANPRLYFLFSLNFYSCSLFFESFWKEFLNLTESLSIILNDDQSLQNINQLFSQLNLLNNSTTIWNGK